MTTQLTDTGFNFSDGTTQTTKYGPSDDNGYLLNVQTFTGSGTWSKPAGCEKVLVKVQGGGGGAAGYCESGGAGGYAEKIIDVSNVSSVYVTVGGGGNSVGYYTSASDGGTSSFGSYVAASGGYGANRNYSHTGGHGGVGYKGDLNLHGGDGTGHTNGGNHFPAGTGGASYFGGSATVSRATTSTKLSNGAPGSGGPGARTNDGGGGGSAYGESGIVVVYAYSGSAGKLGSTSALAASSAAEIKAAHPEASDGIYWINLPTVGATQVYCLMDNKWDGGGWMMMLKATRGTTFAYGSGHWTGVNTLNTGNMLNRDDGDGKSHVMNYFAAKDMLAVWPDIGEGGCIRNQNNWTWLQNNFYDGNRVTPIWLWANVNRRFFGDALSYCGWGSGIWATQNDIRFYGYNWTDNMNARWGFGWNENGGGLYPYGYTGSDDVSGGIGMSYNSYSAGDAISCCNNRGGYNRSMRVELYVR